MVCAVMQETVPHYITQTMLLQQITTTFAVSIIIIISNHNFYCVVQLIACSITCPAGYAVSNNCDRCIFTSICDRDSLCHNGGNCIQYSPATNYTCNCTGTGYEGVNCTGEL